MKQLYIIANRYEPNSATTNHLLSYAQGIAECGIKVLMIFLHKTKSEDVYAGEIPNVSFRYIWKENAVTNKYVSFLISMYKFRKCIRRDIPVYVYGLPIAFPIILKRGYTFFYERTENPDSLGEFDGILGKLFKKIYGRALRNCDGVFVITPSLKEYFTEEFRLNNERVHVANMVVDANRFAGLGDEEPNNWITYCGMISEWKDGIGDLLKAFAIMHMTHQEYKLVIAGAFQNKEVENNVNELLDELKIRGYVDLRGVVNSSDMPRLLKSSKILALSRPTQKHKACGFATKIGEYLMTERPIVMTNVGDVSYYLQDGLSVILAEPNNPSSFADKLSWVIEHYDEAAKIGQNGKKVALESFNYKIEAKKIIDVIFGVG